MPRVPAITVALPITFLGCGKLGSSILDGLLTSVYNGPPIKKSRGLDDGISTPEAVKTFAITSLIACVHQPSSGEALQTKYENDSVVHVLTNANVEGAQLGDVIILGCKPTHYQTILSAEGMKDALSGKTLVNLMVGVSTKELTDAIYGQGPFSKSDLESQCHIMSVTPNTAAAVRQSMTLIYDDEDALPAWALEKVVALFNKVGEVKRIPYSLNNLAPVTSTLTASTAAYFSLALEGVVKGAVEQGLNQQTATEIAAAAMRGAAELVDAGQTPDYVRQRIATKGGSTAQGLEILEKGKVLESMADAMKKASGAASKMGDRSFWKDEKGEEEVLQKQASEEQQVKEEAPQGEPRQEEEPEEEEDGSEVNQNGDLNP